MLEWTEQEIETIRRYAMFLEDRGYLYRSCSSSLVYEKGNISLFINNQHHGESSDIRIKFIEQNRLFSLTWFLSYCNDMNYPMPDKSLDHIINLIKFLVERLHEITNYEYCLEFSRRIEHRFFSMHPELKGIVPDSQ